MSDSTEKSQRLKSCGLAVIEVLTKHPGSVFQLSARTAFQASQVEEKVEPNWFHDESKCVFVSVCVSLCVSVCVCSSVLFVAQQLQLILVFGEQSLESQVFNDDR